MTGKQNGDFTQDVMLNACFDLIDSYLQSNEFDNINPYSPPRNEYEDICNEMFQEK